MIDNWPFFRCFAILFAEDNWLICHEITVLCQGNTDTTWIRSVGKIIEHDSGNTPTRMMGTHIDITEQKLAEISLRHSEERFRLLLKNVVIGVFIIRNSHILYLDPEKGMTSGPCLESFKSNYFNSADVKKIEIFYKEVLASGVSKEGLEVRFFPNRTASGEENTI
ncbi:MAG: hypothetical protein V2B19_02095 [Pseudomonadota bacterium]